MTRQEFEALRDLPGKRITSDIRFLPSQVATTRTFRVDISNELGHDLFLEGFYLPAIPALKLTFVIKGVGPICRIEANSVVHGDAGRTHKHSLTTENCPRINLPSAVGRPDLELLAGTPSDIWAVVCAEANIIHEGTFEDPE